MARRPIRFPQRPQNSPRSSASSDTRSRLSTPSLHERSWLTLSGKLQRLALLEPRAARGLEAIVDELLKRVDVTRVIGYLTLMTTMVACGPAVPHKPTPAELAAMDAGSRRNELLFYRLREAEVRCGDVVRAEPRGRETMWAVDCGQGTNYLAILSRDGIAGVMDCIDAKNTLQVTCWP